MKVGTITFMGNETYSALIVRRAMKICGRRDPQVGLLREFAAFNLRLTKLDEDQSE